MWSFRKGNKRIKELNGELEALAEEKSRLIQKAALEASPPREDRFERELPKSNPPS